MKCLILGATGLVGQQLLQQALEDTTISEVIAPTRKPLPPHAKLRNPIVDFDNLPLDASWWQANVALCALGTTMKIAGTREAFWTIDHDYVLRAASITKDAGVSTFVYNSSLGADATSGSFYLQVKGKVEADLENLGFAKLGIVRPSFLDGGPRPEKRQGEAIAIFLAKMLAPLLPLRYRAVSTTKVASMMWALAKSDVKGKVVIESDAIYTQTKLK
ncbi:NAD-dependent dehydratase [Undibacterium sp. LX40W]|uniref:NAD-dependent dehydratase n=1 Tax=Undibacterium nitidum TaxID=2762298 RepID=A0A923HQ98_9BURK|nr:MULTISPECIES: NAD(P)H-binding protein [Undibacterium]MBC3883197.1 NAD-dependent dehydratase [Undibacterium nitidum]MBC3893479.1 NAD-dependent dehydratase [Undibacterium sp. LX40W]